MKLNPIFIPSGRHANQTARVLLSPFGSSVINAEAVKLLKLKEGDKVLLFQDTENPKDWYLARTESKTHDGYVTRAGSKDTLVFNAVMAVRLLLESNDLVVNTSASYQLAKQPVDGIYYCILNMSVKQNQKKKGK